MLCLEIAPYLELNLLVGRWHVNLEAPTSALASISKSPRLCATGKPLKVLDLAVYTRTFVKTLIDVLLTDQHDATSWWVVTVITPVAMSESRGGHCSPFGTAVT